MPLFSSQWLHLTTRVFSFRLFILVYLSVGGSGFFSWVRLWSTFALLCKSYSKHEAIALTKQTTPKGTDPVTRTEKDLETMLHEELLKERIILNLEEKMIIASQYLKSCNKQDEADLFDVGL